MREADFFQSSRGYLRIFPLVDASVGLVVTRLTRDVCYYPGVGQRLHTGPTASSFSIAYLEDYAVHWKP